MARRGRNQIIREVRGGIGSESNDDLVPATVTQPAATETSDITDMSLMEEVESEDENHSKADLAIWIKNLQCRVHGVELQNISLKQDVRELKVANNNLLGRAQKHLKRDPRIFQKISKLVSAKIFSCKKFIISQRDLDDFTAENSIGKVVMSSMEVEMPDRLPFWAAYKEIVADAIASRRTTITNDLKKAVMSK